MRQYHVLLKLIYIVLKLISIYIFLIIQLQKRPDMGAIAHSPPYIYFFVRKKYKILIFSNSKGLHRLEGKNDQLY